MCSPHSHWPHGCSGLTAMEGGRARAWDKCVTRWVSERERASLLLWDSISLGLGQSRYFYKLANEIPKFSWAFDRFIPSS